MVISFFQPSVSLIPTDTPDAYIRSTVAFIFATMTTLCHFLGSLVPSVLGGISTADAMDIAVGGEQALVFLDLVIATCHVGKSFLILEFVALVG